MTNLPSLFNMLPFYVSMKSVFRLHCLIIVREQVIPLVYHLYRNKPAAMQVLNHVKAIHTRESKHETNHLGFIESLLFHFRVLLTHVLFVTKQICAADVGMHCEQFLHICILLTLINIAKLIY